MLTWATLLHPTCIFSASIYLILLFPVALVPPTNSSKQTFSKLLPLTTWPWYFNCLCLIVVTSFLEPPATRKASLFFLLAVHVVFRNNLTSQISVAFNLFCLVEFMVYLSHPYNIPNQMYLFASLSFSY